MSDTPASHVTVYSSQTAAYAPLRMLRVMFRDLAAARELAWRLAVRDISAQYRQAVLGVLWAFIVPAANALVWVILSGAGVIRFADTLLPYPVYVFSGTILWSIFMDALNAPLAQVNAARGMLTKLNFPREALIVSGIYQTLFNAGIKVLILVGALAVAGINPGWKLLLFPFGLLSLVLIGTAIGLLITPVGVLYSDVGRGMPLLMQFLMYTTPVVFPMPSSGWAVTLFNVNPLTPLILTTRDWLTGFEPVYSGGFLLVNVAAIALLLVAWAVYRLAMPILIERMSA